MRKQRINLAHSIVRIPVTGFTRGLLLNVPSYLVPPNAMLDCMNVYLKDGIIRTVDGWVKFENMDKLTDALGPVALIDEFPMLNGTIETLFGTYADIYRRSNVGEVTFLTPIYNTGTVTATNGSPTVTGTGTNWNSSNVDIGDRIKIGSYNEWYTIDDIDYGTQTITLDRNYGGSSGSGLSYTVRMIFAGNTTLKWSSTIFLDNFFCTNPSNKIHRWSGTGQLTEITDAPAALTIDSHKNRLVCGNVIEDGIQYPQRVKWSDNGSYTSWAPGSGSEAGYADLVDTPDWILTVKALGDYLAIYKERSIYLMSYVGYPFVFQFRKVIDGIGIISPFALATLGNEHIFMGNDNFYVFNGIDITRIGDEIWSEVYASIDPSRLYEVKGFLREELGIIEFIIPRLPNGYISYSYNYIDSDPDGNRNIWTKRELPATAVGYFTRTYSLTWNDLNHIWLEENRFWNDRSLAALGPADLFGDENGTIWEISSYAFNGSLINAYAIMGPIGWESGSDKTRIEHRVKELTSVEPWAELETQGSSILITARASDRGGGPFTEIEERRYMLDNSSYPQVNFTSNGRIFSLKFSTPANATPGSIWRLHGYLVELSLGGRF